MTIYQDRMWKLQIYLYRCSGLFPTSSRSGSCYNSVDKTVIQNDISPDAVFVGSNYGIVPGIPKILFIGNNPFSDPEDYGTLHATKLRFGENYESNMNIEQFYQEFFTGTPAPNLYGVCEFPLYKKEPHGFLAVMRSLFPDIGEKILSEAFALANGVFCMGRGKNHPPKAIMRKNCMVYQGWIRKIIEVLEPDAIFIFSVNLTESTWTYFKDLENGILDDWSNINRRHRHYYQALIRRDDHDTDLQFKIFALPHISYHQFHGLFSDFFPKLEFKERIAALLSQYKNLI